MSWAIIGIGVGVASTGYSIYSGARQKSKAKKELERLNREKPIETVPQDVLDNQQMAKIRAQTGLPSEQYNQAMKDINRQQSRSLKRATDRGMGLGLVAALDDNANRAIERLGVENAKARTQNERVLMDVNSQIANWKKGIYDRNVRQVWDRNYDYNMGLQGQGNQNIANAINSAIGLAGNVALTKGTNTGNGRGAGLFVRRPRRNNWVGAGGDINGGNLRLDDYGNQITY